ncbi:sigma factor-like helix-turn-helix DNA-binding protein [Lysinibacillus xylanilyticus]|uniref:sigma factor-like helix-turn-helix DNA-binding protein n=1 Tax=Lysinibacillus xylanilyticus TaxID=582475 RepID=UPI003CFD6424
MVQNPLLKSFLENEEMNKLYESYLENPTTLKKDTIEKLFKIHVRKLQLLSYFSRVLTFESQRYDKKIRWNNHFHTLTLDKPVNDGENRLIDLIQDESIYEDIDIKLIGSNGFTDLNFEDKHLYKIVSKLTENQKNILYALFSENLTEEEVSKRLGITRQSVNKAKNLAFQVIRKEYKKRGDASANK